MNAALAPDITSPERGGAAAIAAATWVVIAAYNEASAIGPVVTELTASFPNVVVVDDGSRDHTAATASTAGATVLQHCINLGQGAALQTGIDYALARGAAFVATFDADGQHRPNDIFGLINRLEETGADVALGSRFLGQTEGLDPLRRRVLQMAVVFQRLTSGARLTDAHNGLRVFRRNAAALIRIRQNRMAHASELIAQIMAHHLRIVEAPCTIRYTAYSRAKGQKLTGAAEILLDLVIRRMYR